MFLGVRIRKMHPGLPLIIIGAILLVTGGIVVAIGQAQWSKAPPSVIPAVVPAGATISAAKLHDDAIKTSQEIHTFVIERQRNEPQQSDYYSQETFIQELWDAWVTALIDYSRDTKNLYNEEFGGHVKYLRDEFQKWGLSHKDLDMLCLDATNYFAIRNGADALEVLARQLMPQQ